MTTIHSSDGLVETGPSSPQSQTDFFGRLLRLQQDVLSGHLPQYTLAIPTVEHSGNSQSGRQRAAVASDDLEISLSAGVAPTPPRQQPTESLSNVLPPVNGTVPTADNKPSGKLIASGKATIDFSKQDQVVKGQNKLERFRIERELKKAADSKVISSEQDKTSLDGAYSFDCSKLLQAATSLVKPVSGFEKVTANEDRQSRSPPHTDSYYSSKVDSASEHEEEEERPIEDGEIMDTGAIASTHPVLPALSIQRPQLSGLGPRSPSRITTPPCNPINTKVMNSTRDDSYSPPSADALPYIPNPRPPVGPALQDVLRGQALVSKVKAARPLTGRTRESESYSPPPVASAPSPPMLGQVPQHHNGYAANTAQWNGPPPSNGTSLPLRKGKGRKQDKVNGPGPGPDKRTGRNKKQDHKKPAPIGQKSNGTNGHAQVSTNATTTVHAAPIRQTLVQNNRKRPRESDVEITGRRVSSRVEQPAWQTISPPPQAQVSPAPYVKQEPASPPPFAAGRSGLEPPRRLVLREDGTADIQVEAVRPRFIEIERTHINGKSTPLQMRPVSPRYVQQDPVYLDDEPQPSPRMRIRPRRDDTDLRRMASLQYARRAPSPEVQEISPREMRYMMEPPREIEQRSSSRYQYDSDEFEPRQMVSTGYNSPMMVPEGYSPRTAMPAPPPAKRRIVVDEDGNEYIAIPAGTSNRQSLTSQYIDDSRYAPHQRVSSGFPVDSRTYEQRPRMRGEPEVIDLDDDDNQAMPPPRLVSRKQRPEPAYEFAPQLRYREEAPLRQRPMAAPRTAARAVSIQPAIRDNDQHHQGYRYVSAASTYHPQQQSPVTRERPFSARPDLVQQQPVFGNGSWADNLDARANMRRM